jgi:hypothetical protein
MRLNIFTNNSVTRKPLASSEYDSRLETLSRLELLQEYEEICASYYSAKTPGGWRHVMLCRRELARRLFRTSGSAA